MSTEETRRILIPRDPTPAALRCIGSSHPMVRLSGATMGTTWTARLLLPPSIPASHAEAAILRALDLVVRQMSHWDETSHLCRFNRAPAATWHALPSEFFTVLAAAVDVAAASSGAYDPTIGPLVDHFGFGPADPSLSSGWAAARDRPRWQTLRLDPAGRRAWQPGALQLDLSSIAKGHAVDLAAEALLHLGIPSFLIEIGGELRGHGCKPDGSPWWCLLENPPEAPPGFPRTLVALSGISIATSGDALRRRTHDGVEISHLLDPRTGRPVPPLIATVTVLSDSCMIADAWATALYVAGPDDGLVLAERHHLPALFTLRTPTGLLQRWSTSIEPMLR